MKTITLKADDGFFEMVSELAKQLHMTKSELIRTSIKEYDALVKKRALKKQIKEASLRVRHSNMEIIDDFDGTLRDGLNGLQ